MIFVTLLVGIIMIPIEILLAIINFFKDDK
jgi:hypothetical protein